MTWLAWIFLGGQVLVVVTLPITGPIFYNWGYRSYKKKGNKR